MIRIPQVRVIDEEGNQLGVMPTPRALEMAQERGFDLVEVAPMAQPPVTRFLDFGQYKYELTKREKEAKKRQRVGFKEVRLSPKIGVGDFDTKVHRAIEFLEEGDRLKVTVRFRGRELTHPEIGRNLLTRFTEQIKDHGVVERAPLLEGKQMHLTVASLHKPKGQEGGGQKPAEPKGASAPTATEPKATEPKAVEPKATEAKAQPAAAATNGPASAGTTTGAPAPAAAPAPATDGQPKTTNTDAAPAAASSAKQPAPAPATTGE
jgi:translation initiation factor IF-3